MGIGVHTEAAAIALRAPIRIPRSALDFLLVKRHDVLISGQNLYKFPLDLLFITAPKKRHQQTVKFDCFDRSHLFCYVLGSTVTLGVFISL